MKSIMKWNTFAPKKSNIKPMLFKNSSNESSAVNNEEQFFKFVRDGEI